MLKTTLKYVKMGKLKETLSKMSDEFLDSVVRQVKVDGLKASGGLSGGFSIIKNENGFELKNTQDYANAVFNGVKKGEARPSTVDVINWMKQKGIRPYIKLPNGATKFAKITPSSYKKAAFAIINFKGRKRTGIFGAGLIKRYNYKGSDTLQKVADSKMRKWMIDISTAFKDDIKTELSAMVTFKEIKI